METKCPDTYKYSQLLCNWSFYLDFIFVMIFLHSVQNRSTSTLCSCWPGWNVVAKQITRPLFNSCLMKMNFYILIKMKIKENVPKSRSKGLCFAIFLMSYLLHVPMYQQTSSTTAGRSFHCSIVVAMNCKVANSHDALDEIRFTIFCGAVCPRTHAANRE